jgi:hypothetical protein
VSQDHPRWLSAVHVPGQPALPAAGIWSTQPPAPDPGPGDPYGEDPAPAWPAQPGPGPAGSLADPGSGPAPGNPALPFPAVPATARAGRRHRGRPLLATAAAAILGIGFGVGIAAVSQGPVRLGLADNPAAAPYTPSAGPASTSPGGTLSAPGSTSPPASAGASPSPPGTPASWPPATTKTAAGKVLAAFITQNNQANSTRSVALLAQIEGGTSYAIDAGAYRTSRASDPLNSRYTAITPASSTVYWIPRLPAKTYPRWFAARVTYTPAGSPQQDIAAGYLVVAQASPGAAWKDVLEPYLLHTAGPGPFIATDADGYATAVAAQAPGLSISPGQAAAATAASLDGTGNLIPDPGNLADLHDQAYFAAHLPAGTSVTGTHTPDGAVYALRTAGGGILAFYGLSARLAITVPAGQQVAIGIPGYYTTGKPVTSARIGYAGQFALYVPPSGQGVPQLLADASGIAG